jgi:hypothetical protein
MISIDSRRCRPPTWLIVATLFGSVPLVNETILMSPIGGIIPLILNEVQVLLSVSVLLLGFLTSLGCLLLLPFKEARNGAWSTLGFAFSITIFTFIGANLSEFIRLSAFANLGARTKPVIQAIEKFTHDKGHPPASLEVLVPKYLSTVPHTGIGSYPDYRYSSPSEDGDSPWQLGVDCSTGILNWDVFFYWPTHNYPTYIYGGYVQPVGEWAYVHE